MSGKSRMRALAAAALALAMLTVGACSTNRPYAEAPRAQPVSIGENVWRYVLNRTFDFADIFQLAAGLNVGTGVCMPSERDVSGQRPRDCGEVGSRVPINPYSAIFDVGSYLGAFIQVTDYVKLGHLWFAGWTAEWDGRGFFAGPERRARMGILSWEMMYLDQIYDVGHENYFKKGTGLWANRMSCDAMTWRRVPAKELHYEFWADQFRLGVPPFHRGWQHWGSVSAEVDALFFYMRAGVDLTEPFDFVLGILGLDFKHDDMNVEEYRERRDLGPGKRFADAPKPAAEPNF